MIKFIKSINRVILTLVSIDFFMNGALGTIAPFFAIFITGQIEGGSATVAGFAATFYWVTKSLIQLPIARWLDKTDGELDEFWAFFSGYLIAATIPIMYFFSTKPWHIYLAEVVFGFAMAWAVPAWYAIFTRHIDKFRIGLEWSLYSVFSVGIATSISAALGGVLVDKVGFKAVFLMASLIMFLSALSVLSLRRYVTSKRGGLGKVFPEHALFRKIK